MSAAWITLSFSWDFANVQSTLNTIIGLLGTIGIWTFSRLWYQQSTTRITRHGDVPLSSLLTPTSLGEIWDIMVFLKGRLLDKDFIPLLAQAFIVVLVTVMTILSGVIARFALRSEVDIRQREIPGLLAATNLVYGVGGVGSISSANVFWNTTMNRLDEANFPTDQLLDYLPSNTLPWVYQAPEWNSTWHAACSNIEETHLNLAGDPKYPLIDPIHAFPTFTATLDPKFLNNSNYRYAADFCAWLIWDPDPDHPLAQSVEIFVMFETEPTINDEMEKNQAPLTISLSVLKFYNASIVSNDHEFSNREDWRINGSAEIASYTRVECTLTRNTTASPDEFVAWPWLNDTSSIVTAYADYNRQPLVQAADQQLIVPPLSPSTIFRFYQTYLITLAVSNQLPVPRYISMALSATQLSTAFLIIMLILFVIIAVVLARYWIFKLRFKGEEIPDAKLDWMMYAVKSSSRDDGVLRPEPIQFKDAGFQHVFGEEGGRKEARVFSRSKSFPVSLGGAVEVKELKE